MSCGFNRINIENFSETQNRTPYDQLMNRVYNPDTVKYYPAPWPMDRTEFDKHLQQEWAPNCNYPEPTHPPASTYGPESTTTITLSPGEGPNEVMVTETPAPYTTTSSPYTSYETTASPYTSYETTASPYSSYETTASPYGTFTTSSPYGTFTTASPYVTMAPMQTTSGPYGTTFSPMQTTSGPYGTTAGPYVTMAPMQTTSGPYGTTAGPYVTMAPMQTTSGPYGTTYGPMATEMPSNPFTTVTPSGPFMTTVNPLPSLYSTAPPSAYTALPVLPLTMVPSGTPAITIGTSVPLGTLNPQTTPY